MLVTIEYMADGHINLVCIIVNNILALGITCALLGG
jgi:hypothetical protein